MPFCAKILLILFLALQLSACSRTVTATYTKAIGSAGCELSFKGSKSPWMHGTFFSLDLSAEADGLLPPAAAFNIDGKRYPLISLTTSTLNSLGFSVIGYLPTGLNAPYTYYTHLTLGTGCMLDITICGKTTTDFSYVNILRPSPIVFTIGSGPELTLPLSQEDLEDVFGKPDSITPHFPDFIWEKIVFVPKTIWYCIVWSPNLFRIKW